MSVSCAEFFSSNSSSWSVWFCLFDFGVPTEILSLAAAGDATGTGVTWTVLLSFLVLLAAREPPSTQRQAARRRPRAVNLLLVVVVILFRWYLNFFDELDERIDLSYPSVQLDAAVCRRYSLRPRISR